MIFNPLTNASEFPIKSCVEKKAKAQVHWKTGSVNKTGCCLHKNTNQKKKSPSCYSIKPSANSTDPAATTAPHLLGL